MSQGKGGKDLGMLDEQKDREKQRQRAGEHGTALQVRSTESPLEWQKQGRGHSGVDIFSSC